MPAGREMYRHEEYDLFTTTMQDDGTDEWIDSLWDYLDEENTCEHEQSTTSTCHRTFTPYQDRREKPIKNQFDNDLHPFYRYVTTNKKQSSNDTMDDVAGGECNQLYSIVEETECQVREEVKPVSDRMRRRKKGAYTAYVKHASFEATHDMPNVQIDMSQAQNDPGANRTITKYKELLVNYKKLKKPYTIGGIAEGEVALECWGVGYLPWKSTDGRYIMIRCFHSDQCDGTLISPNDVCIQHRKKFEGYATHCNVNGTGSGWIDLNCWNGETIRFNMHMNNGLWFHHMETNINHVPVPQNHDRKRQLKSIARAAKAHTDQTDFNLWHNRIGHPGIDIMENIHKHANGIPRMKQDKMWKCASCMKGKFKKQHIGEKIRKKPPERVKAPRDRILKPGQGLHMDYGFVRGKKWKSEDKDGKIITSLDGYRSYLLIVDHATRYKWVFLTKRKTPPIEQVDRLLETLDCDATGKFIMTDQGGELGKSFAFQRMVDKHKYSLKLTGAGSSEANGRCERVHQDLGRMMRCLLHGAGLGPEYWSFALIHSTYLLNRWPHSALKMSPYQAIFNKIPDLSHLKVFGSKVEIYKQDKQGAKLDDKSSPGIFLHYAGSPTNIIVQDSVTKSIKSTRHYYWDELHMSSPPNERPPMSQAIASHLQPVSILHNKQRDKTMKITPLTSNAMMPTNNNFGGITVSSATSIELTPGETCQVPTDLAIKCPDETYARVGNIPSSNSPPALCVLNTLVGKECRNLTITMSNQGMNTVRIHKHQDIATVMLEKSEPILMEATRTMYNGNSQRKIINAKAAKLSDHQMDVVVLSENPYDNEVDIRIPAATKRKRTNHPTMGLVLDICPTRGMPILSTIQPSTAAAKITRWRSTIRNGYILGINNIRIPEAIREPKERLEFVTDLLTKASQHDEEITIQMGLIDKLNLHPSEGVPIIYQDQLQTIGRHLHELKEEAWFENEIDKDAFDAYVEEHIEKLEEIVQNQNPKAHTMKGIQPKSKSRRNKLTRRKLKLLPEHEWLIWRDSEHKQLQQYEDQETFGKPCPLPPGANCLPLLWTYLMKEDGRYKARLVCNGAPSKKGSVTLGQTYAAALEQSGNRIFWAAAAARNMVVYGADASNAFAEAPPPKAPLYVRIDTPFREWWKSKGRPDLPSNYVLPVQKALQGHPESARLWADLIHGILKEKLGLQECKHEQCLYRGTFKGTEVLFLRQVDDFCVAADTQEIADEIIEVINKAMSIDIKHLGLISRFNGMDILQTKHYIKLYTQTYIAKILEQHGWTKPLHPSTQPVPMNYDTTYQRNLELARPPALADDKVKLQVKMGFNYRQAIGELLYAMVTCRPDISYACIKMSQYSKDPAEEHYKAVREIFNYLAQTADEGIYFWRDKANDNLPIGPTPRIHRDDHPTADENIEDEGDQLRGDVDSDWAGDNKHRRSITGYALTIAGAAVYYKSKFQDCISLSSTEAEFQAACEAAKSILYVRSILQEIGLEQEDASTLYIDNNGALLMADAKQPTKRTRHMDIKHFKIQEWVEMDLITMKRVHTSDNRSDVLTKALTPKLFYRHMDRIMGRIIPSYAQHALEESRKEH